MMKGLKFKWENFRGFQDTGWIDIKPITVFIGPNASGKSSLIQPFLLMEQTYASSDDSISLMTAGENVSAGVYKDLVHDHEVSKDIVFSLELTRRKKRPKKPRKIGENAPVGLSLTFGQKEGMFPKLTEFVLKDYYGRELIKRKLKDTGKYSLDFCLEIPKKTDVDKRLYKSIIEQLPENFMFTDTPVVRKEMDFYFKRDRKSPRKLGFSKPVTLYLSALSFMEDKLLDLFSSIKYIGPLRARPQRFYEFRGEHHKDVGYRGEFTHSILYWMEKNRDEKAALNKWLKFFELAKRIDCTQISKRGLVELTTVPLEKNFDINVADNGFGLSQLLPLIVQTIISKKGDIILTEQPEIHLNPRLETRLADFFVEMTKEGKSFVTETHSEHFVLRLRTLVKMGKISPDDIAIYFVENDSKGSTAREIKLDVNGQFPKNDWPKGFFEEALTETLKLATTKRKSNAKK